MNQDEIATAIRGILTREHDPRDVEASYRSLVSAGEEAIPHIVSALRVCAIGHGEGRWWDGADKLCRLLAELKTESAKGALLTILKTDSTIVEFDRVRHQAAEELAAFKDRRIIPDLIAASKTPHAPILSIKRTVEALGGELPIDPQVVLAEVSHMPMQERIEHFRKYHSVVGKWPGFQRRSYYWWIGAGVEKTEGLEAALPFYAASVDADPAPDAAAWTMFRDVTPSSQMAHQLARKYPLPSSVDKSPNQEDTGKAEKKWWQLWK